MGTRQEAWILFGRKEQITIHGIAPYIILAGGWTDKGRPYGS